MTGFGPDGGWPEILATLTAGHDIDGEVAAAALTAILDGSSTDAQIAGFIVALRQKGETIEEMAGMVGAMLEAATPLSVPDGCIDIVGMGGSQARRVHALNVSTIACFVAAGAGATVCKHGNRKASSTSGAFDLLDALGLPDDVSPADVERTVRDIGIGFAFARTFHPSMRHVAPVRAQLGIPTVFNSLGPLSHPGRVRRQVIGVPDRALAPRTIQVLRATGSEHALVVHGSGGMDELTVTGPSWYLQLKDGEVSEHEIDPREYGFGPAAEGDLAGGDPTENADITRRILSGEPGARRDIVVLNAAAGLLVAGIAADLRDGIDRAGAAIDDGSARAKVEALVRAVGRQD